jgi:hypothetical protein
MNTIDVVSKLKIIPVELCNVSGFTEIPNGPIIGTFFLRNELRPMTTQEALSDIMTFIDTLVNKEVESTGSQVSPDFIFIKKAFGILLTIFKRDTDVQLGTILLSSVRLSGGICDQCTLMPKTMTTA